MIIYNNTLPAVFLHRLNRFSAEVLINGTVEKVHVKNTGRLGELLVPEARVTLQRVVNSEQNIVFGLIIKGNKLQTRIMNNEARIT